MATAEIRFYFMDKGAEAEIHAAAKQEACNDSPEIPVFAFKFEYGIIDDQDACEDRAEPDQEFYKISLLMAAGHNRHLMVYGGANVGKK